MASCSSQGREEFFVRAVCSWGKRGMDTAPLAKRSASVASPAVTIGERINRIFRICRIKKQAESGEPAVRLLALRPIPACRPEHSEGAHLRRLLLSPALRKRNEFSVRRLSSNGPADGGAITILQRCDLVPAFDPCSIAMNASRHVANAESHVRPLDA